MKNRVEIKEVIIITNELGTEVFTKEGELILSKPKIVEPEVEKIPELKNIVPHNTVASRINQTLVSRRIKSKELSKMTGISEACISQMRNRKAVMSRKNAIKMQEAGLGDAKAWLDLRV